MYAFGRRIPVTFFISVGLCLVLNGTVRPEPPYPIQDWLAGPFAKEIPTPKSVLGYAIGDRMTEHYEMERYLDVLVAKSPRLRHEVIGESYEHRKMHLVIASDPDNIQRLDEIRAALNRLANPDRTTAADAEKLIASTPVVVWFNYANDGNESAAFEAGIRMAYLLAASQHPDVERLLKNAVVILNMAHNPDSHQKYVAWFKATVVGPYGTADPFAAEHLGDWRMHTNNNHYQFDLNRDAFVQCQQESQIVADQMHRWHPQVFIDHHGETKNMYFPPYAVPVNRNLPESTRRWATTLGQQMAAAFDAMGWSYYTGEVFDLFYPGYWDSYPALNGAIGMTFETDAGGRKGYRWEREDGTVITLRDGIRHHMTASLATLATAVDHRKEMLRDYYAFRASALREASRSQTQAYLLDPTRDPEKTARFVELLRRHRIRVLQADREFRLSVTPFTGGSGENRTFPAGTYVIPVVQPQYRLLKALFEIDPELEPAFLEQVKKAHDYNHTIGTRARPMRYGFYDITAWSLPVAMGVDVYTASRMPGQELRPMYALAGVSGGVQGETPRYAYAFTWQSDAAAHLLAHLLDEGLRVAVATEGFTGPDGSFPRGTVLVRVERNPRKDLREIVDRWSRHARVPVHSVNSAYTPEGIDLGSNRVVELKKPKVAVLTEEPTRQTSYGAVWFIFEQMLHYPFTALRWDYFGFVDLQRYNVLVVPDASAGRLKQLLRKRNLEKIHAWVQNGGTLVLLGGASELAADPDLKWTSAQLLGRGKDEFRPHRIPGALLKVRLDPHSYLTLGYEEKSLAVLMRSSRLFKPSETGLNVAVYAVKPRLGGYVFDDMKEHIPGKAYLIDEPIGRGHIILFSEDPNFRLLTQNQLKLFLNAVLFSPSFAGGFGRFF